MTRSTNRVIAKLQSDRGYSSFHQIYMVTLDQQDVASWLCLPEQDS
jgi:hypothetical protein